MVSIPDDTIIKTDKHLHIEIVSDRVSFYLQEVLMYFHFSKDKIGNEWHRWSSYVTCTCQLHHSTKT